METSRQETGVLLIDWDNVYNALRGLRKDPVPRDLAGNLIIKATEAARENGLHGLGYKAAYAQPLTIDIGSAVTSAGLAVITTRDTKEAADLRITIEAIDRYHHGYRFFVFVTGDRDFVPVLQWLNERACTVYLWHGQETLPTDLQNYQPRQWIADPSFMEFPTIPEATSPEDMDLFILLTQRMSDLHNRNLWSYPRAIETLTEMGSELPDDMKLTRDDIAMLWERAVEQRVIYKYHHQSHEGAKVLPRRGLNFTNHHVAELLAECDRILALIARKQYKGGSCAMADLTAIRQGDNLRRTETIINALVSTGYVSEEYGMYSLSWDGYKHGIVNALRISVLLTLGIQRNRHQQTVPQWSITRQWQRTYRPGGNLHGGEESRSEKEAKRTFQRARSEGILDTAKIGEYFGWFAVDKHVLVKQTIERACLVITTVARLMEGTGRGPTVADVSEQIKGMSIDEVDFWLSALASERAINLLSGHVTLNKRSRLKKWLLTQCE